MRTGSLVRALLIAASCAVMLAGPRMACAQQEVVESAGPLAIPLSNKSVERIAAVLKLDSDQKGLAKSLYAGYRASYKQAAAEGDKEIKELVEKQQEGHGAFNGKERVRITKAFVAKSDALEKSFLEDVKAILTPEQAARFERAEKSRRRETGCRFSFVSGEGVDVLQVLADLKIDRDATPELKEATEKYENDADRMMVAKEKMLRGVFEQLEKLEGPESDPKLIEKTIGEFFDTGAKVRDMNRQAARQIEPLLPADKRAAFDREIKKISFPRVYAESHVETSIKTAQGFADLTPEQKSELASVAESYAREAEGANARWAAAIEDKQSKISGHFMELMGAGDEDKPDDPLKQARDARHALDERVLARVTQVLKPEQREKIPKPPENKDRHRSDWEPDFDERGNWEEWKKEDE